jgi:Zn-dependent alcohol dehydrogenase
VELVFDAPSTGEITVTSVAARLCHSDDHLPGRQGGSGVAVDVGNGVEGFVEGDRVAFSVLPACWLCRWCASGMQNFCDLGAPVLTDSRFGDPTSFRLHLDDQHVEQMAGLTTCSEHTTVDVNRAVKVPRDVPRATLPLLGCGVATGWGSAVNSAQARRDTELKLDELNTARCSLDPVAQVYGT